MCGVEYWNGAHKWTNYCLPISMQAFHTKNQNMVDLEKIITGKSACLKKLCCVTSSPPVPVVYRKVENESIQQKLFHAKLANIYSSVQYKLCWRECFQTAARVVAAFTIKQFCYWQIWAEYSFSEDTVHLVIGVYASGLINGSSGPFHGKSLMKN